MQLEDGFGSGSRMRITADGSAVVQATTIDVAHHASHIGTLFSVVRENTAYTLAAGQSGAVYLKNTGTTDVQLDSLYISLTAAARIKIIRNPTTGTLITAGTPYIPVNLNFSSGFTFTGDCKLGADSQTITSGTTMMSCRYPAGMYDINIRSCIILERGASVAITITPEANCVADISIWMYSSSHN